MTYYLLFVMELKIRTVTCPDTRLRALAINLVVSSNGASFGEWQRFFS